ncbi:MAG: lipoyl synthase [Coriobacteriia bacterium]|nr:lipoyl synthase [Coriobacteriia bacterium]
MESEPNTDTPDRGANARKRMPAWLRRPIARPGAFGHVDQLMDELDLNTVCQSAKCPNRGECFSSGTATFLIMGGSCTRACRFCAVESRPPLPLDSDEPRRVAEAAHRLGLKHVVITTVTRDDLPDGGAEHLVSVIRAVREAVPGASVEVLTSDFAGRMDSVDVVQAARPDVFSHNMETVPRLYSEVRPQADYRRSLAVLARARSTCPDVPTKSGLMLGLGETPDEVLAVLGDLRQAGVEMLTLGQYLQPSADHLPVVEFVEPSVFVELSRKAYGLGFTAVASAPFVRSSYHAGELADSRSTRPLEVS